MGSIDHCFYTVNMSKTTVISLNAMSGGGGGGVHKCLTELSAYEYSMELALGFFFFCVWGGWLYGENQWALCLEYTFLGSVE